MITVHGKITEYSGSSTTVLSGTYEISINRDSISVINQKGDDVYEVIVKISDNSGFIYEVNKKDYLSLSRIIA